MRLLCKLGRHRWTESTSQVSARDGLPPHVVPDPTLSRVRWVDVLTKTCLRCGQWRRYTRIGWGGVNRWYGWHERSRGQIPQATAAGTWTPLRVLRWLGFPLSRRKERALWALWVASLAAIALSACGGPPDPVRVEVVRRACVTEPPPKHAPIEVDGPDDHCPAEWGACLSLEALVELGQYLSRLQRWADAAWISCRPAPTEGPNP